MAEHRRTINAAGITRPETAVARIKRIMKRNAAKGKYMAQPYPDMFRDIAVITTWLNAHNADMHPEQDDAMRVMKIGEEFGEVVAAYIGYTGQNPRKGRTHSLPQLLDELADVAVTALCAIQRFTEDENATRAVMTGKLAHVIARAGAGPVRPPEHAPTEYPPVDPAWDQCWHTAGHCRCGAVHSPGDTIKANNFR